MSALNGKITLITGGTTGIGLATAQRFLAEGAKVIVTGRNPETLAAARELLGGQAEVLASDAADPDQIQALFRHVQQAHGRLDVLFLNAGVAQFAPLDGMSLEAAEHLFRVNFHGPWLALRYATPLLSKGASVIFNTSAVNQMGLPGASVYAATKAALRSLVRTATAELAPRGIRVNAVSPGPIETPIIGKLNLSPAEQEGFGELARRTAAGRFGQAHEVAGAALFLASSDSSLLYGAELNVDGGLTQI
jgi:NAD(P)-dependent dehydrogenase (short-subunit alcohol dehydrogenase family)